MSFLQKSFWQVYFILISFIVAQKAGYFFMLDSPQLFYFKFICYFDSTFFWTYFSAFLQICLNILHCLPILLYAYQIHFLKKEFWQYLLIFRLIFDITGHSYEINYVMSLYYDNPKIALIVLLASILVYIPSYWACYRYAFWNKNLKH